MYTWPFPFDNPLDAVRSLRGPRTLNESSDDWVRELLRIPPTYSVEDPIPLWDELTPLADTHNGEASEEPLGGMLNIVGKMCYLLN